MLFATLIPDWNSLDSVRRAHSHLEAVALAFFALLVLFDVLAHLSKDESRKTLFEKIGLCFFAVAVVAEIAAYPYGQRNDALSERIIGSLDTKAEQADHNANTAISNSATALSHSEESVTKSGIAEEVSGKALDKSNKANMAASGALSLSRNAQRETKQLHANLDTAFSMEAQLEQDLQTTEEKRKEMALYLWLWSQSTLRLGRRMGQRTVDHDRIVKLLIDRPHGILQIGYAETDDREPFLYAQDLKKAFEDGGWYVPDLQKLTPETLRKAPWNSVPESKRGGMFVVAGPASFPWATDTSASGAMLDALFSGTDFELAKANIAFVPSASSHCLLAIFKTGTP